MHDVAPSAAAVEVCALSKEFGVRHRLRVLDEVDLVVERAQVLGMAGPNGAGKSTLLKVLLGLVRPTSGAAFIFGEHVGPGAGVLARVGAMVDGPGFLPYLSGRKNLELIQRANRHAINVTDLEVALGESGLGTALDRPYRAYSHGMRYRLGLASAMMGHPDLLLLDEPTTGLDPTHVDEISSTIRAQAAAGVTIILSSHDLGFIQAICTHVALLIGGRVTTCASVPELVQRDGSLKTAYSHANSRKGHSSSGELSP